MSTRYKMTLGYPHTDGAESGNTIKLTRLEIQACIDMAINPESLATVEGRQSAQRLLVIAKAIGADRTDIAAVTRAIKKSRNDTSSTSRG